MTDKSKDASDAEIRNAVYDAIQTWARLEDDFAGMLDRLLALGHEPKTFHQGIGALIYYTPSNIETRIELVDSALSLVFKFTAYGADLKPCWEKLKAQIFKVKQHRNAVVHGQVRAFAKTTSTTQWRVVAPSMDRKRGDKESNANQFPGMSAHDVRQFTAKVEHLRGAIPLMWGVIHESVVVPGSWKSSLRKLQLLRAHLGMPPKEGSQTPSKS